LGHWPGGQYRYILEDCFEFLFNLPCLPRPRFSEGEDPNGGRCF
jgi:hypothetical protein